MFTYVSGMPSANDSVDGVWAGRSDRGVHPSVTYLNREIKEYL